MKNSKSEKKAFLLFIERCEKLGMQYFVELDRGYPTVYWWYKGLTKQECWERGCVRTVADLGELWNRTYSFFKTIKSPAIY